MVIWILQKFSNERSGEAGPAKTAPQPHSEHKEKGQSEICSDYLCQNSQYRQQDATSKDPWVFDGR